MVYKDTGEPIFPPYAIKKFGNIKVGFIGMTLEGTPNIVSASGIQDVDFLDEAETANKYAAELRNEHGVRAIVVLLHEGGTPTPFAGIDSCNVAGAITDIVDRTSDAVDLFVTGHTHQPYVCTAGNNSLIDGRPVTSASSFGRLVTNIGFTLDHKTKDIKDVTADNTIVTRTQTPAADIQQLIAGYNTLAAPIANQRVGRISANIPRETTPTPPGPLGLNPLGYLIADAQLADTDDADRGDADIALMNPGGVRADLTFASSPAGEGDGVVTYGEAFTRPAVQQHRGDEHVHGRAAPRRPQGPVVLRPADRAVAFGQPHVHVRPVRRGRDHRRDVQPGRVEPRVERAHQRCAA